MAVTNTRSISDDDVILVTGGHGMLGLTVRNELASLGRGLILGPNRKELDLLDAQATRRYFEQHKPTIVIHLASVVFGLLGNMKNQLRAIADSTIINHNVMMAAAEFGARKIFFAGSVASYPFPYSQLPLTEDMLWNGLPHHGEYGYAHAKRHALAYLEILRETQNIDFFYGLLTNLYGPNDRFDDAHGHVIPSLVRKMHRSKTTGEDFRVWGDGSAKRDFMHVRDAARAIIAGVEKYSGVANISSGEAVSIKQIAESLARAARYEAPIIWETDKPVGVPERSVSNRILRDIGFECRHGLDEGILETWNWFEQHHATARH